MATKSHSPKNMQRAFFALNMAITDLSGKEFQLTPAGEFASSDGRPANLPDCTCKSFVMDAVNAALIIEKMTKRTNPTVIDYEHQTQMAEFNGMPAPAAGWYSALEWREGQGLFAIQANWTERASAMIAGGEYKYISPVMSFDPKTGRITNVIMAALTNQPALDGMKQVTLAAMSAISNFDEIDEEDHPMKLTPEELAKLGLPATATPADLVAAFAKLQKEEQDAKTALAGKANADPAQYVPVAALNEVMARFAALSDVVTAGKVEQVVALAVQSGQIIGEALISWATELGKKDLPALEKFVAAQPKIAALTGNQTGGAEPAGGTGGATADTDLVKLCQQMNLDPAVVKKVAETGAL